MATVGVISQSKLKPSMTWYQTKKNFEGTTL